MKRDRQHGAQTVRTADVKQNLTQEQLAAIGGVAIAWNEMELFIHFMLGYGLWMPWPLVLEVTTRINGIEGQIEIIRKLSELHEKMGTDKAVSEAVLKSLSGIKECKTYRDAVIHARVLDAPSGIGELIRKRGKQEEVLLTVEALNGLYERMVLLRNELVSFVLIFQAIHRNRQVSQDGGQPNKQSLAQAIQAYLSQVLQHQTQRLSLPPLPSFPALPVMPEETEVLPPNAQI